MLALPEDQHSVDSQPSVTSFRGSNFLRLQLHTIYYILYTHTHVCMYFYSVHTFKK